MSDLSLVDVIDRAAAAREIARVLRPGEQLVATVWVGPQCTDIVLLQQMAGGFVPEPPVPGASEVASLRPGDQLIVGRETFILQEKPERRDPDRLVWGLDARST